MAKPTKPASFDKTNLAADYEALYDKASAVIPIWEESGTTVEELKTGSQGTIVDNGGDGLGPDWANDAEGWHLVFPGDAAATGRYIDFSGTALAGLTYNEVTVVGIVATEGLSLTDDGLFWRDEETTAPLDSCTVGFTDDAGEVGNIRAFVEGDGVFEPVYSNTNINDGSVHTIVFRHTSDQNQVSVDGGAFVTGTTAAVPTFTSNQGPFIGDDPGSTEQWEGPIYAVYMFETALSDAEKDTIHADPYGMFREVSTLEVSVTFDDLTINETGVKYVVWDNADPTLGSVIQTGSDAEIVNGVVNLTITAAGINSGDTVHLLLRKGSGTEFAWTGQRTVSSV